MGHGCIGLIMALNGRPRSQVGLLFTTRTLPSLEEPSDDNQLGQNIQQTRWKKDNFLQMMKQTNFHDALELVHRDSLCDVICLWRAI